MSDETQAQGEAPKDPHDRDPDFTLDADMVRAVKDALDAAAKHNTHPDMLLAEQFVAVASLSAQPSTSRRGRRHHEGEE